MISAVACWFRREAGSHPEHGIAICKAPGVCDVTVIVDTNGQLVYDPWTCGLEHWAGSFVLPAELAPAPRG